MSDEAAQSEAEKAHVSESEWSEEERKLNAVLGKEPEFKVEVLYGHCEIRSWFEYDGEKLVGMGSKKTYDKDGKLTDYSESPTGLVMPFV